MNWRINKAAHALRQGGIIAYPTEAVWGLGCDPANYLAVSRLLHIKHRDITKGLIVIAAEVEQLQDYLNGLSAELLNKLMQSWPGPVTWLVPDNGFAPYWIKGQHATVALRVTDHPLVQALCYSFGGAIVSTSANPADRLPAKNKLRVKKFFQNQLDYILPGSLGNVTRPTTIKELTTDIVYRY